MQTYLLSIITPAGKVFEDQVESLMAPGIEGSFGVLKNHAPMVAILKKGVLKIRTNGHDRCFAVGQAILEINRTEGVLLLSDSANETVPSTGK